MAFACAAEKDEVDRTGGLPPIPVVDLDGAPLAALVAAHAGRVRLILDTARAAYSAAALRLGDAVARRWAARLPEPYRGDIAAIAQAVGEPGAWMLNFSYEWGCTTAGVPDPDGHPRLVRALDWRLPTLGRTIIAVRMRSPAGRWLNLTWPGFAGAVQGLAPGRFAAAINQAPGPRTPFGYAGDWLAGKLGAFGRHGLPPVLALRHVFERAGGFVEAKRLLTTLPVCAPALFSIVGQEPGEGVLIERAPGRAVVHEGLPAAANHWLTPDLPGRSWSVATGERLAAIRSHRASGLSGDAPFVWLRPPILNPTTRLALEAVPAHGHLIAQGWEADGPATAVLDLVA